MVFYHNMYYLLNIYIIKKNSLNNKIFKKKHKFNYIIKTLINSDNLYKQIIDFCRNTINLYYL